MRIEAGGESGDRGLSKGREWEGWVDAGVIIWGKGITFTAGIPISSGLFSVGGCMVGVVGKERTARSSIYSS